MGILVHLNSGKYFLLIFLAFFLFCNVPAVTARNLTNAEMQAVLDESVKKLLTGQPFSTALEKRQQTLRDMFEAGAISKDRLIKMVESSMMPILDANQDKTSVEVLKALPRRIEALLAPHMTWKEVKAAGWRIASPLINESIRDILTGQPFRPELEKKQLMVRKMFEAGLITKKECIDMVGASIMPILDEYQEKTSVTAFKNIPARVTTLLSPYMTWEEVKKAGWDQASPLINESIKDILTGKPFRPELEKKQIVVRKMFEAGLITKEECIDMVEKAMLPILETCRTSRYILKDAEARVEALLTPYMTWEEVEKIGWRIGSALIGEDQQAVLKIATLAPPGTPWMNIPQKVLLPRIAKLSDNKMVVKVYGGGTMGEDTDILRKMDIGQLDGCGCTALGIIAASPDASALLVPGLFRNYEEVDYILNKFRKRIDRSFEEQGYILSALIDTGFFYIFSKNEVSSLADLKKQKPLTWFGEMETTFFKALGLNATPVAVPETISALSTNMANVNIAPAAWMLGMQAYQYARYYFTPPVLYSPGAILVSLESKEKLRKQFGLSETLAYNFQEMLVYEVCQLEPIWKKEAREYEANTLKAFQSKCGMKPVPLSAADRQLIEQAAVRVNETMAGKLYSRELMNDIQQALADFRAGKE